MNIPALKDEPVAYAGLLAFVAGQLTALAAKHGITLDPAAVASVLGALALPLAYWVRRLVHPASKVEALVRAAREAP